MIACVDVHYRDPGAVAAGLWFQLWSDSTSAAEVVLPIAEVAPYQSGQFYLRELPCLLAVLEQGPSADILVIDGYVWLEDERPGLGAHLYRALGEKVAVIGAAKTRYAGVTLVQEVRRGTSGSPLYITAAGMDLSERPGTSLRWTGLFAFRLCSSESINSAAPPGDKSPGSGRGLRVPIKTSTKARARLHCVG